MKVDNVFLELVTVSPKDFPTEDKPEIAFVGRSNVGKSSLINTMINRKSLARTSKKPGKTRTINFYNVENKMYFVDLPGYGYAKVSKAESQKWGNMIEEYLLNRKQLKGIIMLIDIRHEPLKNDLTMYNWLKYYNHRIILVGTKSDKLKKNQINKNLVSIRKEYNLEKENTIINFSSYTKDGKENLWDIILEACK